MSAQHQQVYQDLARVLTPTQLEQLRKMARWGRYGPSAPGLEPSGAEQQLLLALMSEFVQPDAGARLPGRLRQLLQGELAVPGLSPTPRQAQALTDLLLKVASRASPGDRARVEVQLRTILTPEQLDFLKQLERSEP